MKRAILEISDVMMIEMIKGFKHQDGRFRYYKVIKNTLPEDAKPIRCILPQTNSAAIGILLESEKFEDVALGNPYPILNPPHVENVFKEFNAEEIEPNK